MYDFFRRGCLGAHVTWLHLRSPCVYGEHMAITAGIVRAIAVEASVDPRSVVKVLRGEHVKGIPGDRIREALVARGYQVSPLALSSAGKPEA